MTIPEYIEKLEQGLRALVAQEREAQEQANTVREARLRQEGALLALRQIAADTPEQEGDNG